jgi:hypothetical protein
VYWKNSIGVIAMTVKNHGDAFNENQILRQIDQFVSLVPHIKKNNRESQKILLSAMESLNKYAQSTQGHQLNTREVAFLGASLFKLHSALPRLKKFNKVGSSDQLKKLYADFDKLFYMTLIVLLKDPRFAAIKIDWNDLPLAKRVFDEMLGSICSDAHEEVVGQERTPGALPTMIAKKILLKSKADDYRKQVLTERIHTLAAALYPMAIVSATLDSKAQIPTREQEYDALNRDKSQFDKEFKSQFGARTVNIWSLDFFGNCLQTMWEKKREKI